MNEPEHKFKVGQVWRAKRPVEVGGSLFEPGYINDRVIKHVGMFSIQYDGPSIKNGRHYPSVTHEQFARWAGRLLDEKELPQGDWATWERSAYRSDTNAEANK
jgi:hypothetical protein